MRKRVLNAAQGLVTPLVLVCAIAAGQSPQGGPRQALDEPPVPGPTTRVPSPVVQPDGKVTFTLRAPQATTVKLNGDYPIAQGFGGPGAGVAMTKDPQGVWSVTLGPLPPEFYSYSYTVDGVRTPDRANQHASHGSSWFIIPGPVSINYQLNDVPHGEVRELWYASPTLKLTRRMVVYTPPGYQASQDRYPVLYLLHGGGMDELTWSSASLRAPEILDNLIAQGKAVPMIVVMPNGYVNEPLSNTDALVPRPLVLRPHDPGGVLLNDPRFPDSIVHDIVPYMDKYFRTKADRGHRALAGLSMGGAQALYTALNHVDLFSSAGLFSPAVTGFDDVLINIPMPADAASRRGPELGQSIDGAKFAAVFPMLGPELNGKLHLYYSIGDADGGLLEASRVVRKVMDEKGVKYTWVQRPGYGHEASIWRLELLTFSSQLFKPAD